MTTNFQQISNAIDINDLIERTKLAQVFPDPIIFQYYNYLCQRKIVINDQIDAGTLEYVTLPLLEMDNDGTNKPIEILLSTRGGSTFDGLSLCDIIDQLKTPTTITVMTYAFSMGALVLMGGIPQSFSQETMLPV